MGSTVFVDKEELERRLSMVIHAEQFISYALPEGHVAIAIRDFEGSHHLWALDWKGAAWLAASLMTNAASALMETGIEQPAAGDMVQAHYDNSIGRIIEAHWAHIKKGEGA